MRHQTESAKRPPNEDHMQTLTVSSKGQITISADARRKLSIDRGTHLLEMVVGDCLVYVPDHTQINLLLSNIQESLRRSNITVDDLVADVEAHRDEVFREFYPDLEPSK